LWTLKGEIDALQQPRGQALLVVITGCNISGWGRFNIWFELAGLAIVVAGFVWAFRVRRADRRAAAAAYRARADELEQRRVAK